MVLKASGIFLTIRNGGQLEKMCWRLQINEI